MTTSEWGRVDDDGTVYVKTADGERSVGQYAAGTPDEALAFYTSRYDALGEEVSLLEQRVRAGNLSPEEAQSSVKAVRDTVLDAKAVGDLAHLAGRLDALAPIIASQRAARKEERAQKQAEAKDAKLKIVEEAEKIAGGKDWRHGAPRLRQLLDEWKALPRLDRAADDELWHRFSGARSTYTKARKVHFAEMDEKRAGAQVVKQRLLKEAEALSGSTEWGPTAGKYRELMRQWKAAGPAPREVEDDLWSRFRAAQDTFFGARDAANAALDEEFAANAVVKDELIVEAEKLVPVTDLEAAKKSFRAIAAKWDEAGKVPRDRIKELEGRMRAVEQAIRSVEDEQWRKSNPEKSARADGMVAQLEATIAKLESQLEKAQSGGDDRAAKKVAEELEGKRSFLEMAKQASADYSG